MGTQMKKRKKLIAPYFITAVMIFLLLLIGVLAYILFDALAQRSVRSEPFVSISTGVVQRVSLHPPQLHESIVLDMEESEQVGHGIGTMRRFAAAPAICIHYGDTITSRTAWRNPLEFSATLSSDRVVVQIVSPPENGEEESP